MDEAGSLTEEELLLYQTFQEQAVAFAQGVDDLAEAALTNPYMAPSQLGYVRAEYNRVLGLLAQFITLQRDLSGISFEAANQTAASVTQALIIAIFYSHRIGLDRGLVDAASGTQVDKGH